MPHIKTGFYKQYERESAAQKPYRKFMRTFGRVAVWVARILFYGAMFALSSIGATALANEPVRELLIQIIFP